VSDALPAESWELEVSFNFVIELTIQSNRGSLRDSSENTLEVKALLQSE
jgi:hypothetical protein